MSMRYACPQVKIQLVHELWLTCPVARVASLPVLGAMDALSSLLGLRLVLSERRSIGWLKSVTEDTLIHMSVVLLLLHPCVDLSSFDRKYLPLR